MSDFIMAGVSFPKEVLKKLDDARGDIPRSRYICKLIRQDLEEQKGVQK